MGKYEKGPRDTSMPWSDDEFIRIDGVPLVYSVDGIDIVVHWPGGFSARLVDLAIQNRKISRPKKMRG